MREILVHGDVPAAPRAVFTRFTDHQGWVDWAGVQEVVLRQRGDPPPNGLGAIRVMRARGIAVEEEVTRFDPPKCMAYRLVAGIPVREYEGEVHFEPGPVGTRVTWRVRFKATIPGTGPLLGRGIRRYLVGVLDRLRRHHFSAPETRAPV